MPKRKTSGKKAATSPTKRAKKEAAPKKTTSSKTPSSSAKIVIEACKSWGLFKRESAKLKALLADCGGTVLINPGWDDVAKTDKDPACRPRKGTFEVRVNGEPVVSLVAMPRPFKKLRTLDMADVAKDVKKAC